MRYKFRLARDGDDSDLRKLYNVPMEGGMQIAFGREPNFFIAERSGSVDTQTMIIEDIHSHKIIGCGSRSERLLYVDGVVKRCGYLHGLRKRPGVSNGKLLIMAYKYFHKLHKSSNVSYYFTTILSDNSRAQKILTSGRFGLPNYVPCTELITCLIPILHKRSKHKEQKFVQTMQQKKLSDVVEQINNYNSQYLFAPHYTTDDFNSNAMLPNFHNKNMYLYVNNGNIYGTAGIWDQKHKQIVVTDYSLKMNVVRQLYNVYARWKKYPLLPCINQSVNNLHLAFVSVNDNDVDVFEQLLLTIMDDWSGRGYDYLSVGLCGGHPLLPVLRRYASWVLKSDVYLVYWDEDVTDLPKDTNIHVEVATL